MSGEVTYRLPDWLGGHPVKIVDRDAPGFAEPHMVVKIVAGEYESLTLAVPFGSLVEVRPPSIDDPAPWPLEISRPNSNGGTWDLDLGPPNPLVAHLGAASLNVTSPENKSVGLMLSPDELRLLARAAWQRANAIEAQP